MSRFITCFQVIENYFHYPPPLVQQVEMAYSQLRLDWQKYMTSKPINSFDAILLYEKEYEGHLMWVKRFSALTPKEKLLTPEITYTGPKASVRVHLVVEKVEVAQTRKTAELPSGSSLKFSKTFQ